jgi:hypothetical protein
VGGPGLAFETWVFRTGRAQFLTSPPLSSVHPSRHSSGNKPPSPCTSRPEESWDSGSPKVMKSGSCSATTVPGSTALPFVISTEAQRSGEICVPFLEIFRPEKVMGLGPPKVMTSDSCSATAVPGSTTLPLSSRAERSAVEGPAVQRLFLGNAFRKSETKWRDLHSLRNSPRHLRAPGCWPTKHRSCIISVHEFCSLATLKYELIQNHAKIRSKRKKE